MKKRIAIVIFLVLIAVFFIRDIQLTELVFELQNFESQSYTLAVLTFLFLYVIVTLLALPGAALLSFSSGIIFGFAEGVIWAVLASGISSVLSFLLGRYLLRDFVEQRFQKTLEKINAGVEHNGPFYLFFLRVVPGVPFAVLNMSFGVTRMKIFTYWWISQLAMLPVTLLFVNAGIGVEDLSNPAGIFTMKTIVSLLIIGVLPLIIKVFLKKQEREFPSN